MIREELDDIIATLEKKAKRIGAEKVGTKVFSAFRTRTFRCCVDCSSTVELYMVWDAVWSEAHFGRNELACIPCLEKRLGRATTIADFTPSLANINLFRVYRMGLIAAEASHHAVDRGWESKSARKHLSFDAAIRGIEAGCVPLRGS